MNSETSLAVRGAESKQDGLPTELNARSREERIRHIAHNRLWHNSLLGVPPWIASGPLTVQQTFLAGLLSRWSVPHADGCVYLPLTGQSLLHTVRMMLLLPFAVVAERHVDLPVANPGYVLRLRPPWVKKFVSQTKIVVDRKRQQIERWTEGCPASDPRQDGPFIWMKVQGIEHRRRYPVWRLPQLKREAAIFADGFALI